MVVISIDGFSAESLWDPDIPLPTIRRLAKEGAYAEGMIPSTPSATWANHTTLVTGVHPAKHEMLYNGTLMGVGSSDPLYIDYELDKADLVPVPTVYDAVHAAGLRTANVWWPATRNATSLDDNLPATRNELLFTTVSLRGELIELSLVTDEDETIGGFSRVQRDHVRMEAAKLLVRKRLPHLLLLHLLNVDGTQHQFGKGTLPSHLALSLADTHVRDLLVALDEAGIRERTTIFVVSDHGFVNVTKRLYPNVLLRRQGLLEADEAGNLISARVQVITAGGVAMVFARDPRTREEDIEAARALFAEAEGITRILEPAEYANYGLPDPSRSSQIGDLVLAAGTEYVFHPGAAGDEYVVTLERVFGTHGYLNDVPEMRAVFVAAGRGIRRGVRLGTVENVSVAPTAARLLGVELPTADGKALEEILEPSYRQEATGVRSAQ